MGDIAVNKLQVTVIDHAQFAQGSDSQRFINMDLPLISINEAIFKCCSEPLFTAVLSNYFAPLVRGRVSLWPCENIMGNQVFARTCFRIIHPQGATSCTVSFD